MGKMKKLSSNFLTAEYVQKVEKALKKCTIKFVEEPHLEENEKYNNQSYHVLVEIVDVDSDEGNTIRKTWNMNAKSSDFLGDKFGDTKDFVGEEIDITTNKVNTPDGKKDSIYPVEMEA